MTDVDGAPHIELAPPQQLGATACRSSLSFEDPESVSIQFLSHAAALLEEDAINCPKDEARAAHVPDKSPRENVAPLTKFAPLAHTLLLLRRRQATTSQLLLPFSSLQ